VALADEIDQRWPKVHDASSRWQYGDAMKEIVKLRQPLDRFFTEVLVMTDDARVRAARLSLLTMVRDTINAIAEISEVAPEDVKQA
jgi:glycyl-tRNA synthetase beta chain